MHIEGTTKSFLFSSLERKFDTSFKVYDVGAHVVENILMNNASKWSLACPFCLVVEKFLMHLVPVLMHNVDIIKILKYYLDLDKFP